MSRNLNAATIAILGNQNLEFFHLVTFYFTSNFRLTDYVHDINYNFGSGVETFLSNARLQGIPAITESLDISGNPITLTLTGANAADVTLALTENFINKRVIIRRGYYDSSGNTQDSNIIADPYIIFDGKVDSFKITDDQNSGESTVIWNIASIWADWDKIAGRKCNNTVAQKYFTNETGYSHVYDQIGEKTWGKVKT